MAEPDARELTCREVVALATDYLEGALPPRERMDFERHLVWCSWCRDYLDQIRTTIELTGALPEEEEESLSPEVREQLIEAFRHWKRARDG
jgi:predicted anti-sigma-YlaC factor YlaD